MADSSIGNEDQDQQGRQSFDKLANPQKGRPPSESGPGKQSPAPTGQPAVHEERTENKRKPDPRDPSNLDTQPRD